MFWGKRERETWADLRKNRLRKGRKKREKEDRCATKQNLSRSLSSAITVETSLSHSLPLSLSPSSSLSLAWNEVIRESERGRNVCERERE